MAFIITKDFTAEPGEPEGTNMNAKGVMGPSTITDEEIAILTDTSEYVADNENLHTFKMFDDDGNLYYIGWYLGDHTSEDAFEPLVCFGAPNAGCTYIQYLDSNYEWKTL